MSYHILDKPLIGSASSYTIGDAKSVLQKAIRRGLQSIAIPAAGKLYEACPRGFWTSIITIASEDIGPADSEIALFAETFYRNWRICFSHQENDKCLKLVFGLTNIMCTAKKSRILDLATYESMKIGIEELEKLKLPIGETVKIARQHINLELKRWPRMFDRMLKPLGMLMALERYVDVTTDISVAISNDAILKRATSSVLITVSQLCQLVSDWKSNGHTGFPRLQTMHAAFLCCHYPVCPEIGCGRTFDVNAAVINALDNIVVNGNDERYAVCKLVFEMPDYAMDKHTRSGRQKKRGYKHFFDVASKLNNEYVFPDGVDTWTTRSISAILKDENSKTKPRELPLEYASQLKKTHTKKFGKRKRDIGDGGDDNIGNETARKNGKQKHIDELFIKKKQ